MYFVFPTNFNENLDFISNFPSLTNGSVCLYTYGVPKKEGRWFLDVKYGI